MIICVGATNANEVVVKVGMCRWLVLVHAQSVSGVGDGWVAEARGVEVVFI